MKPIGYYLSTSPGDNALLDEMEEAWGGFFEALNNCQRLWMINILADDLYHDPGIYEDHQLDDQVFDLMQRRDELSAVQKVRLIQAIIDQVKDV